MKIRSTTARAGLVLGVAILALTGCSQENGAQADEKAIAEAGQQVKIEDAWVKAAEPGDMTAAFGTLENSSDQDITVVSVESEASPMMELHETVENDAGEMVMREVEGGFVIPAKGKLKLEPGGDHIMLMDLPEAVDAGEEVGFTLKLSDGSTFEFTAIVKDYSGANENYEGGMGHGEMDHGEHSDDSH